MKHGKNPIVIEVMQFKDDSAETIIALQEFMQRDLRVSYENPDNPVIKIDTSEGVMDVSVGNFIIKGVNGKFYTCKPNIFERTYKEEN